MTEFIFSEHAIKRYIQRHDRTLSYDDAKHLLYREVENAVDLHKRAPNGDADEWVIPALDIRILVRDDARLAPTEAPRKIVVTILPRRTPGASDVDKIRAIHEEAVAVFERVRAETARASAAAVSAQSQYSLAKAAKAPKETRFALTNEVITRQKAVEIAKLNLRTASLELEETKLLLAMVRADELTKRHVALQDSRMGVHRHALRVAINALRDYGVVDALAEIEQIEPSFVSDQFLNYAPAKE